MAAIEKQVNEGATGVKIEIAATREFRGPVLNPPSHVPVTHLLSLC